MGKRSFCRALAVLMYKHRLMKQRSWMWTLFEVILPLLFLSAFIYASRLYPMKTYDPAAYTSPSDVKRIRPVGILPWRMDYSGQVLAILPQVRTPDLVAEVDSLVAFVDANYPAANFSSIGGVGERDDVNVSGFKSGRGGGLATCALACALHLLLTRRAGPPWKLHPWHGCSRAEFNGAPLPR